MNDPYRESTQDETDSAPKIETPIKPEIIKPQEIIPEKPAEIVRPANVITPVAPAVSVPLGVSAQSPSDDPKILEKDRQLKMLVDIAFSKGLDQAVEAARATNNAYLIDEFHDLLVDKLRQELIEKGKLKEL